MENSKEIFEYAGRLEKMWEETIPLYSEYMFDKNSKDGLTHVQAVLMKYLLNKEKPTVSELADYLGVTMAAVSSLVDRLEKGGLINRERGLDDRRVVFISLTAAGKEVIEKDIAEKREKVKQLLLRMGLDNVRRYVEAQEVLCKTLKLIVKEKPYQEDSNGSKR